MSKLKLLVAKTYFERSEFDPLRKYADVYWYEDLGPKELDRVLPQIDLMFSHGWPPSLDGGKAAKMKKLRFVQAGNAGVDGMRFDLFDKSVVFCSNVGGYSEEVAEFAMALVLAGSKKIVQFDAEIRAGTARKGIDASVQNKLATQVVVLKGKKLGVIGYGAIGRATARLARGFGMETLAFGRRKTIEAGVKAFRGRAGLTRMLGESDALVLGLPLTTKTRGFIGRKELAAMKADAIFVNIARGEVVDEDALYEHLVKNPGFMFATDVWWERDGRESFSPRLPFLKLGNFIGTPHVSGPSALVTRSASKNAIANMIRFCKGKPVRNVVDTSEY